MKMPDGGFRPAFNLGFASDPRSTMIAAVTLDNTGSDKGQLRPMSDRLAEVYGQRCLSCVDGPLDARALCCDGAAVGCGHVSGLTWGSLRQADLAASGFARVPRWPDSPRRSSDQGGSPHQPHIRQDRRSQPRSRIRDRGAPRERRHSLRRRVRALPDNGDAPLDWSGQARWSAALADVVSQAAGLSAAPSGMTPCVASRHSAIRSFRASATTMTLRWRRAPPPRRSRNHPTIALPGW
jgi:hypothetical protein